jgi:hypothetical protein
MMTSIHGRQGDAGAGSSSKHKGSLPDSPPDLPDRIQHHIARAALRSSNRVGAKIDIGSSLIHDFGTALSTMKLPGHPFTFRATAVALADAEFGRGSPSLGARLMKRRR